jgi:hypothetical protein
MPTVIAVQEGLEALEGVAGNYPYVLEVASWVVRERFLHDQIGKERC